LAHEGERGLVHIVRHLHRQHAARRQRLQHAPQHCLVIRQPLERGIGKQQIGALRRSPAGQIRLDEGAFGQPLARLPQHVRRGIKPYRLGVRVAGDEQLGGIAGSAAQIDDPLCPRERDLRDQIARRPRALILELEILRGAPVGHLVISREYLSARTSCI
jgi:hypothetical protein